MKKLVTIAVILLLGISKLWAAPVYIDSLKKPFTIVSDSLKAPIYTRIAAGYMRYDTVNSKRKRTAWQNKAIDYTMQALHYYSKYNDTTGLRVCFDNLAKVYHAQKKYSQAKWFILQSNTLSRARNDVPNIITSLIELAAIKTDIQDYTLAMGDLNEALQLSTNNHFPRTESAVQQSYAVLYMHMKDYPKAALALKRHNFIDDSIRKSEEASLTAKLKASDTLQNKKKFYTISNKRTYKSSSAKKIVSL